jgi:hypothetical protein
MTRTATVLPALNLRTVTPAQWAQYELALATATAAPTPAHICHDDTDNEFEQRQREKFKHLSLDELYAMNDTLNSQDNWYPNDYTLADEIANEIDRRLSPTED